MTEHHSPAEIFGILPRRGEQLDEHAQNILSTTKSADSFLAAVAELLGESVEIDAQTDIATTSTHTQPVNRHIRAILEDGIAEND